MKLYEPTIAREITPTGTNISPHVSAAFHRCPLSLKDISEKCERAKKGRKWGGGRHISRLPRTFHYPREQGKERCDSYHMPRNFVSRVDKVKNKLKL